MKNCTGYSGKVASLKILQKHEDVNRGLFKYNWKFSG